MYGREVARLCSCQQLNTKGTIQVVSSHRSIYATIRESLKVYAVHLVQDRMTALTARSDAI